MIKTKQKKIEYYYFQLNLLNDTKKLEGSYFCDKNDQKRNKKMHFLSLYVTESMKIIRISTIRMF